MWHMENKSQHKTDIIDSMAKPFRKKAQWHKNIFEKEEVFQPPISDHELETKENFHLYEASDSSRAA